MRMVDIMETTVQVGSTSTTSSVAINHASIHMIFMDQDNIVFCLVLLRTVYDSGLGLGLGRGARPKWKSCSKLVLLLTQYRSVGSFIFTASASATSAKKLCRCQQST